MGGELLAVHHDGVAGVVAALVAHAVVDGRPEQVGRLALPLIAPLGAEDHDRGHLPPLPLAGAPALPAIRTPARQTGSPDAQQHRGSCEATLAERRPTSSR